MERKLRPLFALTSDELETVRENPKTADGSKFQSSIPKQNIGEVNRTTWAQFQSSIPKQKIGEVNHTTGPQFQSSVPKQHVGEINRTTVDWWCRPSSLSVQTFAHDSAVSGNIIDQNCSFRRNNSFRRFSLQETPSVGNLSNSVNVYHPVRVSQLKVHGKQRGSSHSGKNSLKGIASFAGSTYLTQG